MGDRSVSWVRRSALALVGALTLAVVSGMGPTTREASAAPYTSLLCYVFEEDGQLKVYCQDIEVEWPWDKIFDCWMCGLALDWTHDPVIRDELEGLVGKHTINGLTALGSAAFAGSPAERARFRSEAMEQFGVAARHAGESTMRFSASGLGDAENNRFDPSPDPWAQAAGIDVADGIALLQRAARDPGNAARLRAQAAAQFDEAYIELSQHRVIGG